MQRYRGTFAQSLGIVSRVGESDAEMLERSGDDREHIFHVGIPLTFIFGIFGAQRA
jgi:hypothetical protein